MSYWSFIKSRKHLTTCYFGVKSCLCAVQVSQRRRHKQQQETWGCCCVELSAVCVEGWPHGNDWSQVTTGQTDSIAPLRRVHTLKGGGVRAGFSTPGTVSPRGFLSQCRCDLLFETKLQKVWYITSGVLERRIWRASSAQRAGGDSGVQLTN